MTSSAFDYCSARAYISRVIIIVMYSEQARKLIEQVRANRCNRKGCLSQQRDPIDTVWFGQQYGECREFTCSACFVCSDEAIKAAIPTTHNVLPVSLFIERFANELKTYEQGRVSKEFPPKVMRERAKELQADLVKVELEVTERLNHLANALVGFCKKVEQANLKIFKHAIFEEIIQMNNDGKLQNLLDKVMLLLELLNVGISDSYHFQDLQLREKRLTKLGQQITDITQRSLDVLKQLLETLREKNELIARL